MQRLNRLNRLFAASSREAIASKRFWECRGAKHSSFTAGIQCFVGLESLTGQAARYRPFFDVVPLRQKMIFSKTTDFCYLIYDFSDALI